MAMTGSFAAPFADCFSAGVPGFLEEFPRQQGFAGRLDHGLDVDQTSARALSNDIPNPELSITKSVKAELESSTKG
jgi:hypothetical protein